MSKPGIRPPGLRIVAGLAFTFALMFLAAAAPRALAAGTAVQPARTGLEELEKSVKEFTLPNGLKFMVVERHDAPVFSFQTMVNAGSANDLQGATGLAHMMEHMAFKGTADIGSTDFKAEAPLIAAEETAWQNYLTERRRGIRADSTKLATLERAWKDSQEASRKFVVGNEYTRIVEQNGATGLNASTAEDVTNYYYSLPSNRLEMWALMEGSRMARPVFREFYKERDVVYEERRMRTESSPVGRLFNEWIQAAFVAHPYGNGGIGNPSDLKSFSRTQGEEFYRKNYVAKNMCVALVGDVTLEGAQKVAQKYWSGVSAAECPAPMDIVEPEQKAERRVLLEDPGQPIVLIGWHCPAGTDPKFPAYEAMANLLAGANYSRLNKLLVKEKKIAVQVAAQAGEPGVKWPNLFLIFAVPASGQEPEKVEQAIYDAMDSILARHPFTDEEVNGYKTRARAAKIGAAESNAELAGELVQAQTYYGDWHEFFREIERVNALTPADLMDVMKTTCVRSNRTVGLILNKKTAASGAEGGKQ